MSKITMKNILASDRNIIVSKRVNYQFQDIVSLRDVISLSSYKVLYDCYKIASAGKNKHFVSSKELKNANIVLRFLKQLDKKHEENKYISNTESVYSEFRVARLDREEDTLEIIINNLLKRFGFVLYLDRGQNIHLCKTKENRDNISLFSLDY